MLKTVLFANAASCAIFGLTFLVFSSGVSEFTGSPPSLLIFALGAGLLANAALLVIEARRPTPRSAKVRNFAIGDGIWVLFSAGLVLTGTWITSGAGIAWALGITLFVGACGAAQFILGRRLPEADVAMLPSSKPELNQPKPSRTKR